MFTSFFYIKSPIFIQTILLSIRDLFRAILRDNIITSVIVIRLRKNEFDRNLLNAYLQKRTQKLFKRLHLTPFYEKNDVLELPPCKESFAFFQFQDKENVIKNHGKLKSKKPWFAIHGATSGTTGGALSIPQNLFSVILEQAFIKRHLRWAGYKRGDKRAWIRGDLLVPVEQTNSPFWRYSFFCKVMYFSSFHLSKENVLSYVDQLEKFDPAIIQAYPSSVLFIASYMNALGVKYRGNLKSIVTSSESLTSEDRMTIETFFNCKIYDWYGLFERVAAIGNCEFGSYHLIEDYAVHELVPVNNNAYEICGTNLNNHIFHIVRYKTGDIVDGFSEAPCKCGRIFPTVKNIQGRISDYLIGDHGNKVFILNHISKNIAGIYEVQYVQNKKDEINVHVVSNPEIFDTEGQKRLIQNIKMRLGKSMRVNILHVDKIPRTKAGKLRQAVCSLSVD